MEGSHSQDIKESMNMLIDRYIKIFKKDKVYTGDNILFMLNKIKQDIKEVF